MSGRCMSSSTRSTPDDGSPSCRIAPAPSCATPRTTKPRDPLDVGAVRVGGDRLVLDDQDPDLAHGATATASGNRTVNTAPTNAASTNPAPSDMRGSQHPRRTGYSRSWSPARPTSTVP